MLIDLSRFGPLTIDPSQYLTTLAVRLDVPKGKPGCGVFAGRHQQFAPHEEGKLVPCIENEDESPVFLLDRPESQVTDHMVARWVYAAIGWESAIYAEYPYVWELTLTELAGNEGELFLQKLGKVDEGLLGGCENGDPNRWHVSLRQNNGMILTLILPEYVPGALARGDYTAIKR